MFSNIEEFAKEFIKIIIVLLIDFFLKYDQINFASKSRNFIVFITSLELLRMTRLSQDTINLVVQFVKIVIRILKNFFDKCCLFVNNINVKKFKSNYNNKKIVLKIRLFVLKHI